MFGRSTVPPEPPEPPDPPAPGDGDGLADVHGSGEADGVGDAVGDVDGLGLMLGSGDADADGVGDGLGSGVGQGLADGDADGLGDVLGSGDGDVVGLADGDGEALGLADGDGEVLGLADGDGDADVLGLGEGDAADPPACCQVPGSPAADPVATKVMSRSKIARPADSPSLRHWIFTVYVPISGLGIVLAWAMPSQVTPPEVRLTASPGVAATALVMFLLPSGLPAVTPGPARVTRAELAGAAQPGAGALKVNPPVRVEPLVGLIVRVLLTAAALAGAN